MSGKNVLPACVVTLFMTLGQAQSQPDCLPAWQGTGVQCLDQNWTNQTRDRFWFIDQGSRIMPVAWFDRLERKGSTEKFSKGLDRYGFITDFANVELPGSSGKKRRDLPIGFAVGKHRDSGEEFVGLTCAACHSGLIAAEGKRFMIEGAPSMVDFDLFLSEMVDAMGETLSNGDKWSRFANGLPASGLKQAYEERLGKLRIRRTVNTPSPEAGPAGFGRVDAFGHIFNQVVFEHLRNEPKNAKDPPDAPASYPMLWDIAQHKYVQWNYSAPNLGVGKNAPGSLVRNIGEVLGVFGEVKIERGLSIGGFTLRAWKYETSAETT
ncbi:MAG: di-heme-cytochrome C peroxidase [Bryobacteraceae bacterium]